MIIFPEDTLRNTAFGIENPKIPEDNPRKQVQNTHDKQFWSGSTELPDRENPWT
jgi:hypothetical protein